MPKAKAKTKAKEKIPQANILDYPIDELDQGEEELIGHGAYDLILLENASEIFRSAMMELDNRYIERILEDVVTTADRSKKCIAISSETFDYYMPTKLTKDPTISTKELKEKFEAKVDTYRAMVKAILGKKPDTCIVSVVALDLAESGGHYAALYYENPRVLIFDSMQGDTTNVIGSSYTPFFKYLAHQIFGESTLVVKPDCIGEKMSLQLTGGFLEGDPYILSLYKKTDNATKLRLAAESTESQNHFCYMWAIYSIHLRLSGRTPEQLAKYAYDKMIDPLVIIKKYIWGLVRLEKLKKGMGSDAAFYERHFPFVWSNAVGKNMDDKERLSLDFKRYRIDMSSVDKAKNLDELLNATLEIPTLTLESKTSVPSDLEKVISDRGTE
jgi:hypothetical protein